MRYYEGLFFFDPSLSADHLRGAIQKVEGILNKVSGKTKRWVEMGRKSLGSPVKKKSNAFAYLGYFEVDPSQVSIVENDLKFVTELLKASLFRIDAIPAESFTEPTREAEPAVAGREE